MHEVGSWRLHTTLGGSAGRTTLAGATAVHTGDDARRFIVGLTGDGSLAVECFDARDGARTGLVRSTLAGWDGLFVRCSDDPARVWVGGTREGSRGEVYSLHVATGALTPRFRGAPFRGFECTPDGAVLALAHGVSLSVYRGDSKVFTFERADDTACFALTPDGARCALVPDGWFVEQSIRALWIVSLPDPEGAGATAVRSGALSPLALYPTGDAATVWFLADANPKSGTDTPEFAGCITHASGRWFAFRDQGVAACALASDGESLLLSRADGGAYALVIPRGEGTKLDVHAPDEARARGARWQRVAPCVSPDATVRTTLAHGDSFWSDVSLRGGGPELRCFGRGHRARITALIFSRDGLALLAGDASKTRYYWNLSDGSHSEAVAEGACLRATRFKSAGRGALVTSREGLLDELSLDADAPPEARFATRALLVAAQGGSAHIAWADADGLHISRDRTSAYTLPLETGVASALAIDAGRDRVAVGYEDGRIEVYSREG